MGGQGGCEQRSEVIVKFKKKYFGGGGGVSGSGGSAGGVRVIEVIVKMQVKLL